MLIKLKLIVSVLMLNVFFSSVSISAPVETFKFETKKEEKTFHKLSEELRCLVCQNQNIAESNAGLAKDLRLELFTMISDGKSEDEIVAFMVKRYGDYVLYRPPFKPLTWILWIGPIVVFLLAIITVIRMLKGQSRSSSEAALSEDEVDRLQNLKDAANKKIESKD